jgi:hypothetical protein
MTWNVRSNIRIKHGKHRRNVSLCKIFVGFPNNHRVLLAHRLVPPFIRISHTTIPPRFALRVVWFAHVLTDIEHEIEPAGEAVASIRYPHQQFALE